MLQLASCTPFLLKTPNADLNSIQVPCTSQSEFSFKYLPPTQSWYVCTVELTMLDALQVKFATFPAAALVMVTRACH